MMSQALKIFVLSLCLSVPAVAAERGFCESLFGRIGRWLRQTSPTNAEKSLSPTEARLVRLLQPVEPSAATAKTARFDLSKEPILPPGTLQGLHGLHPQEDAGHGYQALLTGRRQGRDVFVKVTSVRSDHQTVAPRTLPNGTLASPRNWSDVQREVAWVKRLSDLGIGPRFEGVTVLSAREGFENHLAIVTENFPGTHIAPSQVGLFSLPGFFPPGFRPTRALLESLRKIKSVLLSEGIRPTDLQLRISRDRAVIVDPESFVPATHGEDLMFVEREMDRIISAFEKMLK